MTITTQQLIEHWPGLTDPIRRAMLRAVASTGKNKGFLKAQAPGFSKDPTGNMAWNFLQSSNCPQRVSVGALVLVPESLTDFREEMLHAVENCYLDFGENLIALAPAVRIVEPDLRWNLFALHHDLAKARETLADALGLQEENHNV